MELATSQGENAAQPVRVFPPRAPAKLSPRVSSFPIPPPHKLTPHPAQVRAAADVAAELIASLAGDRTALSGIVNGGFAPRIVGVLAAKGGVGGSSRVQAALSLALRRAARASEVAGDAFADAGAALALSSAVVAAAQSSQADAHRVAPEALAALGSYVHSQSDADAVLSSQAADGGVVDVIIGVLEASGDDGPAPANLVNAALLSALALCVHGSASSCAMLRESLAPLLGPALRAPRSRAHTPLQAHGLLLLHILSLGAGAGAGGGGGESSPLPTEAAGASLLGVLDVAIANVRASATASVPKDSAPTPTDAPLAADVNTLRRATEKSVAEGGIASAGEALVGARLLAALAVPLIRASLPFALDASNDATLTLPPTRASAAAAPDSMCVQGGAGAAGGQDGLRKTDIRGLGDGDEEKDGVVSGGESGRDVGAALLLTASLGVVVDCVKVGGGGIAVAAKKAGALRAALRAYDSHSENDAVHDAFTDAVDALISEEDVIEGVFCVARGAAEVLRAGIEPDTAAAAAVAFGDLGAEGVLSTGGGGGAVRVLYKEEQSEDVGGGVPKTALARPVESQAAAVRLCDALCLLEASTLSARLSAALVAARGVRLYAKGGRAHLASAPLHAT